MDGDRLTIERAIFVCMRPANDVSRTKDYAPAPQVGKHDDEESAPTTPATERTQVLKRFVFREI